MCQRRFFTQAGFSSRGRMSCKTAYSSILYAGPSLYFMLLLGLSCLIVSYHKTSSVYYMDQVVPCYCLCTAHVCDCQGMEGLFSSGI